MARVEAVACGIPDFGPVVRRKHILSVAKLGGPALTVVCAPPGYGKSVLAAQLAAASAADLTLWVPLYDSDVRGDEWLGHVLGALSQCSSEPAEVRAPSPSLNPGSSRAGAMLCIRDALAGFDGRNLVMILDGVNCIECPASFVDLAQLLRKCTSPDSRVVVTCRSITSDVHAPDPATVWLVGEQELLFDSDEVAELLALTGPTRDACTEVERLLDRFAGHPALTSLMVRHERIDDQVSPPQDLIWYTARLVAQVPDCAAALFYGAALLREGSVEELEACLDLACQARTSWDVAQIAVPLFRVVYDDARVPIRFRMHAVLCDAVIRRLSNQPGKDVAIAMRASVLTLLGQSGDFVRLQRALLSAGRGDEIAEYCERYGMELLSHCGPAAVERCMSEIPAPRLAGSPRLLLLRAAALRERERVDEALTHASLAQRIAETDGDLETQAGAALLAVRLAVDNTDFRRARAALGQLRGSLRAALSGSARCLCESYSTVLEAYAGNSPEARDRLTVATELLDCLDKRSPEAVWSGNCIAAVQGQLLGRWDNVNAVFASMRSWPALTSLQSLQCRANAAVALLEMGCLADAETLLAGVIVEADDAGLTVLKAYALGTLADASWFRNKSSAEQWFEESQRVLSTTGDFAATAGEQSAQAMLRRAEGQHEESLAFAEASVMSLRQAGGVVRLLRQYAEIEVATSLLALGDRWDARRVASRILEELTGSEANMHLLCVNMLLAELERQEGAPDSAIARLKPYAQYVNTGSANWRMAMYARAFPELFTLFVAAYGAENLPLRMLRLVASEVIDAALSCDAGLVSAGERRVLVARAQIGATPESQVSEQSSPALCRVRFFGGFEVATEAGPIEDLNWRKRKVRLLFAMLAARGGQDLPRDVLLERLWPGMDEERARRNFYVTWSAMKRALSSGMSPDDARRCIVCSSGVCRVTRSVRSDLGEFNEAVERLQAARAGEGGPGILAAARQLVGLYKGEFLPGDVYEEWFIETREQTKHDFCDAMMAAAQVAEAAGNPAEAIVYLRKAGAADPWREDIYQSMMRCQMNAGQRSRAIETYMACRGRLVDDLGIDPSFETTRLYQAVLAMECSSSEASPDV